MAAPSPGTRSPRVRPLALLGLLALTGCVDPFGWSISKARTTPPPAAFDEAASFAWRAAWGMSQSSLARYVADYKRDGYRPHDLEVYREEGATRFAGIWLKDPRAWQARWRYARAEFDRDFRVLRGKGYQPIDLEIINEEGTLRYSAVWIENPGGPAWVARWDLRHEQFLDELESWRARGYRPVDLEIYGIEGNTRYAYIMVHDPARAEWVALWGKTVETMGPELDSLTRQGYRVLDFEPSYPQGELRLSAILVKDDRVGDTRWTLSRSTGQIQAEIARLGDRYRPIHMAIAPHKEGGMAYLWIWQRN